MTYARLFGAAAIAASTVTLSAQADHAGHGGGESFGRVRFPTSCSAAVQADFDRAVAMLHSFFYPETEKAFRAVADKDPSCAMAYWGIAISQRPNPLTAPFGDALLKQGWDAVEKARTTGSPTALEREWIDALAAFYRDYQSVNQRTRSDRYEAAMARLHARHAHDTEATVFYALALLEAVDLTDKTYAKQLKAAKLLEPLQRAHPDHPGIPHYLIHAYDYAPIAAKGLPAARRYATLAPSAPHALHMPSHTFSTLGMWPDAIRANIAADAAARTYAASSNAAAAARPASIAGRYHLLDFLANAHLQLAQDAEAGAILAVRNSIDGIPATSSITAHTGWAAIPVRYTFERGAWQEAAALPPITTTSSRPRPSSGSGAPWAPHGPVSQCVAATTSCSCHASARSSRRPTNRIGPIRSPSRRPRPTPGSRSPNATPRARSCGCARPRTAKTAARNTWRWRIACRRCASCSASCCSRPASRARRCGSSRPRCG
jgi:hypothetical protein